jgi:hypothetical protein
MSDAAVSSCNYSPGGERITLFCSARRLSYSTRRMCVDRAMLTKKYERAVEAYDKVEGDLKDLRGAEYESAWRRSEMLKKVRDLALQQLLTHEIEHGC